MNKKPIRHDFWIGTIWNRSRVNIALGSVPRICLPKPKILSLELRNFHCRVLVRSYYFDLQLQKGEDSVSINLEITICDYDEEK